ncbi:hypothetical protein GGTG_13641 [Gaeumannomyces tritici R3-111a-1]|uniref:Choline transporter n=1 Tax=Gaeumannomyces tritici (strain R3-111a-1) TaxID=644352 RepID=J3PJG0_GAET3|nr:hypothetical protein GGTG_13641 [Gaeumannomyces tritici R3-111a-1]EJT68790.1 hypothetical protein GGTG_13641 [Gaeumannomyces tritici R3-111a-1]
MVVMPLVVTMARFGTLFRHGGVRVQGDGGDQAEDETVAAIRDGVVVNASGHKDQLKRQYSLLTVCGTAMTVDNAWAALGSSYSISILNGGPPGLIFGLVVAAFYYSFIGLSLAELASSVPTSGGVYHWATIAGGPRWGRILGFFTGWINFYGWMFDLAALLQIAGNIATSMYAVYHGDTYEPWPWTVYVAYLAVLWTSTFIVIFANRIVPASQSLGMFVVLFGGIATIVVLAVMPSRHASSYFVWGSFDENNKTGWPSGVAFLLGVLNGAFTVGTPDSISHMAEELAHPKRDLPKAIGVQIGSGFLFAFVFAVTLSYATTDLDALQDGFNSYPLAGIYAQATASPDGTLNRGATFGLLFILITSLFLCCIGTLVTNSRLYWSLARDNAVPLSGVFGHVNENLSCPVAATLFVAVVATGLGAIPLGSSTAFLSLTGSFIILTTVSYAIPFLANLMSGRRNFPPGPFHLGRLGVPINITAVIFITLFDILYCFPYLVPTTAESMNYSSVILVGTVMVTGIWWLIHARENYPGPKVLQLYIHAEGSDDQVANRVVTEKTREPDLVGGYKR